MSPKMALDELERFLSDVRLKIERVEQELDQVQVQFVSAYQTNKSAHDATLNDLSARAAQDPGALPPDVRQAVEERVEVERETLEKRRQDLTTRVVPEAHRITDELQARARQATDEMRGLNPRLNEREEDLKARRAQMEADLTRLNEQIRQLSGCLSAVFNFFKISRLDRERHKLLGSMEENARALRDVREEWAKSSEEYAAREADLQQQWIRANVDAARAREELAQLDDADTRNTLAVQRAAFYVLDNWKTALPSGGGALAGSIDQMAQLNIETDAYAGGLGEVAGLIALLKGIGQGVQNVKESVDALISEQKMHSEYLSPVSVDVSGEVIQFHQQWDDLGNKVKDEKALGQDPAEFSALFKEEVKGSLAEESIKRMFDSLSGALQAATAAWKG